VPSNSRFTLSAFHDPERAVAKWFRCEQFLFLALTITPGTSSSADQILLLEVYLNGHSIAKVGDVYRSLPHR